MLLAIDIGNSNIVFGLFNGESLEHKVRVQTYDTTAWQQTLQSLPKPKAVMLASVVPAVGGEIKLYLQDLGVPKGQIYEVDTTFKAGIHFESEGVDPRELGADLFVNAVANHYLWGKRCLSVDLGTASKFCVLEADGLYRGTTIVPGMRLSLDALIKRAPLLPEIPFAPTPKIINNTTVPCLQSGIFYGYCALVDGLIKRIKEEHGDLYVVLTGGIGHAIHKFLEEIDVFVPDLTLQGAQILYKIIVGESCNKISEKSIKINLTK